MIWASLGLLNWYWHRWVEHEGEHRSLQTQRGLVILWCEDSLQVLGTANPPQSVHNFPDELSWPAVGFPLHVASDQHDSSEHFWPPFGEYSGFFRVVPLLSRENHEWFCLLKLIQRLGQWGGDGISKADFAARSLSGLARIACFGVEAVYTSSWHLLRLTLLMIFKVKLEKKTTEKVSEEWTVIKQEGIKILLREASVRFPCLHTSTELADW